MPTHIPQGQSWATENKIRGISGLLEINLNAVKSIRQKHAVLANVPYFHFDLNAGSGWNDGVPNPGGIMGTPLVFMEAVARTKFDNYHAYFVDQRSEATAMLAARPEIEGRAEVRVITEDNFTFCERIPSLIQETGLPDPRAAFGTVLLDPNGPVAVPWEALSSVFDRCKKLDCILNFPGTGVKRLGSNHESRISLDEVPTLLHKKHWLIRQPTARWQWTLVIGRNTKLGDWKKQKFYYWDSKEGLEIRSYVTQTLPEYQRSRQGDMFDGS